jgi:ectoine hydroxylase-related dioxygenase (phytanoyl-CoA dioxygenase family)
MRSNETYAIRQVMRYAPSLSDLVWNEAMKSVVHQLVGKGAFVSKSIWFDKPAGGNWFVGYHQDISINVVKKMEVPGFSRWTSKHGLTGVVPPVEILQNTLTLRIHLDRADASNGALRLRPGTHRNGITQRPEEGIPEVECPMEAGDVMLMRPLLLHASMRSTSNAPRRVLHLEVTSKELDGGLNWSERWPISEHIP